MRIVLATPPDTLGLEVTKVAGVVAPPLGLAYIASVLEQAGHRVYIVDSTCEGLGLDEFVKRVKSLKPDMIGMSLLTPTAPRAYRAARRLREELPGVPLVAGGPHASMMPEEALAMGFDVVVRFEGEYTMRDLAWVVERDGLDPEALKGVEGIVYRGRGGEARYTRRRPLIDCLDELPMPAYHLLPMDKYRVLGKPVRIAHVMASRGCPYGCMYCLTSHYWGRRLRFRSPERVAEEVELLVDKYHVDHVAFADDDLAINKLFVKRFVREVEERGIDVSFSCGARVTDMTREYMEFLYSHGFVALYFGVESASQETLNRIGKKITVDQVRRVFRWAKELGGVAAGSFILGFPWETISDMEATIRFAVELDPSYAQFTLLTPYPGTPLYTYAVRHNLIVDWDWEHYTTIRAVMRGFRFTARQARQMLRKAYRVFYLRKDFILRELRAGRLRELLPAVLRYAASLLVDAIKTRVLRR